MAEDSRWGQELTLKAVEEGKILTAVCEPSGKHWIDADSVHEMLSSKGFGNLFIFDNAIEDLVGRFNKVCENFSVVIGEKRDGKFSVAIPGDRMQAALTILPPYGGSAVTADEIREALQQKGIVFGILDEKISESVAEGECRDVVIATGIPPVPGEDSQFLSLIAEVRDRCPTCNDKDTVDYRDLGDVITVKPGDPLMRRTSPTKGQPGRDITGREVAAPDGTEVPYQAELAGTRLDPDDPDLLVADIAGQPVLVAHGVMVEPVITVKNVDLSSGNLNIAGTLKVSSDVKAGMKIKATGDIIVGGVVEAAHLDSGGDIEVSGGIIGQTDGRNDKADSDSMAVVHAKGSVRALYVENASVAAGVDIVVQEVVMKSELSAGNSILIGEQGSGKGRIIGGQARSTAHIHSGVAGSRAGVATRLEVGVDPAMNEKLTHVSDVLAAKEKELDEITKSLAYIRENPNRFNETAAKEKQKRFELILTEVQGLQGQKKRLQKRLELLDTASIIIERTAFSGVQVRIGEKALLLEEDLENATFRLGEEGIEY
jgi:uncharacterized protein (DUF342 family)